MTYSTVPNVTNKCNAAKATAEYIYFFFKLKRLTTWKWDNTIIWSWQEWNDFIIIEFLIILFISKPFFHCHHSDTNAKVWVSLYRSGCAAVSILRNDPTTDRHGGFHLLRLRPGSVHPSLDDLVVPSSPRSTISIPNLVRTPDLHSPLQPRSPELKRSASLSLPLSTSRNQVLVQSQGYCQFLVGSTGEPFKNRLLFHWLESQYRARTYVTEYVSCFVSLARLPPNTTDLFEVHRAMQIDRTQHTKHRESDPKA